MNESCCSPSSSKHTVPESTVAEGTVPESTVCPVHTAPGQAVDFLTVAALVEGRIPSRQRFWLCRDPECEVVYFGDRGATFRIGDVRVQPGFKQGADDGLLCYCFEHRRSDVEEELRRSGETTVVDRITAEMRAGNCACKVRNPSGKCCLSEIRSTIEQFSRTQPEAPDHNSNEQCCEVTKPT